MIVVVTHAAVEPQLLLCMYFKVSRSFNNCIGIRKISLIDEKTTIDSRPLSHVMLKSSVGLMQRFPNCGLRIPRGP